MIARTIRWLVDIISIAYDMTQPRKQHHFISGARRRPFEAVPTAAAQDPTAQGVAAENLLFKAGVS